MNENLTNLIELVNIITKEIKNREDKKALWAGFKKRNEDKIKDLLGIKFEMNNVCNLISFDIDEDAELFLLNYTSQAHNLLHSFENGWTKELRLCRGLVFSFKDEIKIVSRGFEKFFNHGELPENTLEELERKYSLDKKHLASEKIDGHMIEYFIFKDKLRATTRGKFGTASSIEALEIIDLETWNNIANFYLAAYQIEIMSIVVELVTPNTFVHVDYRGERSVYVLAVYDIGGNRLENNLLKDIVRFSNNIKLPKQKMLSLKEVTSEIKDRKINNNEGWVVDFDDQLIKFKYETYIAKMVMSKLSHRYLMNCIINNRLDKMLDTLSEEEMQIAISLLNNIHNKSEWCRSTLSYKPLYSLWSDEEGTKNYFNKICRDFYKKVLCVKNER